MHRHGFRCRVGVAELLEDQRWGTVLTMALHQTVQQHSNFQVVGARLCEPDRRRSLRHQGEGAEAEDLAFLAGHWAGHCGSRALTRASSLFESTGLVSSHTAPDLKRSPCLCASGVIIRIGVRALRTSRSVVWQTVRPSTLEALRSSRIGRDWSCIARPALDAVSAIPRGNPCSGARHQFAMSLSSSINRMQGWADGGLGVGCHGTAYRSGIETKGGRLFTAAEQSGILQAEGDFFHSSRTRFVDLGPRSASLASSESNQTSIQAVLALAWSNKRQGRSASNATISASLSIGGLFKPQTRKKRASELRLEQNSPGGIDTATIGNMPTRLLPLSYRVFVVGRTYALSTAAARGWRVSPVAVERHALLQARRPLVHQGGAVEPSSSFERWGFFFFFDPERFRSAGGPGLHRRRNQLQHLCWLVGEQGGGFIASAKPGFNWRGAAMARRCFCRVRVCGCGRCSNPARPTWQGGGNGSAVGVLIRGLRQRELQVGGHLGNSKLVIGVLEPKAALTGQWMWP